MFVENIWQILNERFSFSQVEDKDVQFLDSMKIARENIFKSVYTTVTYVPQTAFVY